MADRVRLVGYVRVSKVAGRQGDSFQSPGEQREAIDHIVALTPGAEVVEWIEELDESGGTMDRPGVQKAIGMVDEGRADGIVTAYLDRWARTVEALTKIEEWEKAGKLFVTARERFDSSTSQGKFALGMMLLVAQYQRDRAVEMWDASTRNAIKRGVHPRIPYGYRRAAGDGEAHPTGGTRGQPLAVYEPEAAVVRRVFAEAPDSTIAAIARGLNADGIPAPKSPQWTRQTVRAILRTRSYLGEARYGQHVLPHAHEAIVETEEWERAFRPVRKRNVATFGPSLLAGLVRCAGCGYVMGAAGGGQGRRRYNCNRRHAAGECGSPTTAPADKVEQLVVSAFLERYPVKVRGAVTADPVVSHTRTELDRATTEFTAWRDDAEMRELLGDADYRAGLKARKQRADIATASHEDAIRNAQAEDLAVDESLWPTLTMLEQRELLRAGIDAVVLSRAASTRAPLPDRLHILWTGELPDNARTRQGVTGTITRLDRRP